MRIRAESRKIDTDYLRINYDSPKEEIADLLAPIGVEVTGTTIACLWEKSRVAAVVITS
jgi:hypothetical protein